MLTEPDQDAQPSNFSVPKLADVATAAGVSTATVSRCLNSPDQVSKKTLARVLSAVEQLGYAPNFSARALAAKRTNTIGAIIPTMDNAIFARGIQAFQEELQKSGYTLLVASSSYEPELEEEQIKTLTDRGADALFLIGYRRSEHVYDYLAKRQIPYLIAWAFDPEAPHLAVGFNNRRAMRALAQEVLARGHRQIGFITADISSNDRARDRVFGVKDALGDYGLADDAMTIEQTTYSIENGAEGFRALMRRSSRPSVVMCGNDVLAIGALKAAIELGMDVPAEVSITGFDDIELASVAPVALTTVHVPHRRMGQCAAQTLIDLLHNRERIPSSIELPADVCFRDSLGHPGQSSR